MGSKTRRRRNFELSETAKSGLFGPRKHTKESGTSAALLSMSDWKDELTLWVLPSCGFLF